MDYVAKKRRPNLILTKWKYKKLEQKLKIQIIDFSQGRNPQNKKQS